MPLINSASNEARESNIREMMHSGHPQNQAIAAAYAQQRKAKGGKKSKKSKKVKNKKHSTLKQAGKQE